MLRSLAASFMALTLLLHATRSAAQEVPPPPRPTVSLASRCPTDAEWHPIHGCSRHSSHWVFGPSMENVLGSLAIFGVGYALQLISTAITVSRGRDDIGPRYSRARLNEFEQWGYAPLVGPWAKLGMAPPHVDDAGAGVFLAEGLFQLAGVVFFVIALITHEEDVWTPVQANQVRLAPSGDGLALQYTFN